MLFLPTDPSLVYTPDPWFMRWLQTMPPLVVLTFGVVALAAYLLKKPVESAVAKLFDDLVERIKRSSKQPVSEAELSRKARKAVLLEQLAERQRLAIRCDHVEVYGCKNGEYLRAGDGIDKFVMLAEAARPGDSRYMDTDREVFAQDIPRTVAALVLPEVPYLLFWTERCDDWKVNKLLRERNYTSSIAVFIRRPLQPGGAERGVIGMYVISWRECLIYRADQADTLPAEFQDAKRALDAALERLLVDYANEYSYKM